jgi:type VI secretion system ImpJ/VasE family protein
MRFEEALHWNDGQFLQPHHFQYLQRFTADYNRLNRSFFLPYPYGIIDFELDREALSGLRVAVRRFAAVMPDGLELSTPGNCILRPLDLSAPLKEHPTELTIYIAVPLWSALEGNLGEGTGSSEKKIYLTQQKRVRDENSGDNEIAVITRRINARLLTNLDDAGDMQMLPLLKLNVLIQGESEVAVTVNEKYIPPFMMLTADNPLLNMASNLLIDVRRCRDKLMNTLSTATITLETFEGPAAYTMLQLRVLNLYESRLSSLLVSGHTSPFGLYLELKSFLAELMALKPKHGIREVKPYVHDDAVPQFTDMINDIRSFIIEEGGAEYLRLESSLIEGGLYLYTPLNTEDILKVHEIYLAIRTKANKELVIRELELGDTFKVISPQSKALRSRGIKLTEMRYVPRFLPVLDQTLWFRLEFQDSPRVWREICEEKGILIDYAHDLFPELETSLFITIVE